MEKADAREEVNACDVGAQSVSLNSDGRGLGKWDNSESLSEIMS